MGFKFIFHLEGGGGEDLSPNFLRGSGKIEVCGQKLSQGDLRISHCLIVGGALLRNGARIHCRRLIL